MFVMNCKCQQNFCLTFDFLKKYVFSFAKNKLVLMVSHGSRLFSHGSWSVFMVFHCSRLVFHGSRSVFMVFHGSRLVYHGSRSVFMIFNGSRLVFHGFLWFQVGFL